MVKENDILVGLFLCLLLGILFMFLCSITPKPIYEYKNPNISIEDLGSIQLKNGNEIVFSKIKNNKTKTEKIGLGVRMKF